MRISGRANTRLDRSRHPCGRDESLGALETQSGSMSRRKAPDHLLSASSMIFRKPYPSLRKNSR
jgi:hypothetical protein